MPVQDPQHASSLPGRHQRTLAHIPQHVIICQVGQARHVLSHLVHQLVEGMDDKLALGLIQSRQIALQLLVKPLVILALTRDATVAAGAGLVGEHHSAEGAIEEVVTVKLAGGIGRGGDGQIHPQQGIACHAVGRGAKGSRALAVIDVAQHLAHLPVSAAHAVGHLHLRHVDVLCASALRLQRHSVLQERRIGYIRGRKVESHLRSGRLLLVCPARLHHTLPLHQSPDFPFVMPAEILAYGFHESRQLALVSATFCHQIGHHTTRFLPSLVRIEKFRIAQMRPQSGEKHRNEGRNHVI